MAAEAVKLARRFGAPADKAELAGLLHDSAASSPTRRSWRPPPLTASPSGPVEARRPKKILHGPVAAAELAERGVDPEVVAGHRPAHGRRAGMTVLEKCVYLADYCEPARDFPGVDEVRALARDVPRRGRRRPRPGSRLLDLIGRGRGVVPAALALYNETHAGT